MVPPSGVDELYDCPQVTPVWPRVCGGDCDANASMNIAIAVAASTIVSLRMAYLGSSGGKREGRRRHSSRHEKLNCAVSLASLTEDAACRVCNGGRGQYYTGISLYLDDLRLLLASS